ncbi:OLC1v1009624C1 [Oldenlandia corymbosa var. corymbosa]|uniref:OLC1v1009624C1 n=1 Tax=Oldenlandia corymbosa var. corymbosa TaxID=529605 RepID=A0AAV1DRT4_OLDCO|nr:OLC1v1009624C1 [Oldenlandia corymbosa var. corymbosa]
MVLSSTEMDSLLEELERMEIQSGLNFPEDVELELKFLKLYVRCLTKCEETGKDTNLVSSVISIQAIVKETGGQIVAALIDTFLEDLADPLRDCAEFLRGGLIFMITFFMDQFEDAATNGGNELYTQVAAVLEEALSLVSSLYIDELEVDSFSERQTGLSVFQSKIEKVKAEVAEVYFQVPNLSDFSFPMTNVKEQLFLLKPDLKDIMGDQIEGEEHKDLWKRVINVVKNQAYWSRSKNDLIHKIRTIPAETPPAQGNTSRLKEVVIGMKDESQKLIDRLKRGTTKLDIISIVGMPGLECGFPEEITSIIHLRYFAIWCRATELPSTIANLWNLQTLCLNSSAGEIPLPSTIWQMKSLRHVCIPSMSLIGIKHHEYGQLEFMDFFSTPVLNSGEETKEFLRSLRRLTLGRLPIPWTAISVIGQLPNLEVLKLRDRVFQGKTWDVEEGEFLKLKCLELWQLNLEEWNVPDEPFPCLEQLTVKNCYNLEGIPSTLGYIPTLKKIDVRWCFKATNSAKQILEEQLEMGNDGLEAIVFG